MSEIKNAKPLTEDKKKILKDHMGIIKSKIDLNKVRNEWRNNNITLEQISSMTKCSNCGGKIEEIALLSNPPIYKKICENCGEININDIINTIVLQPSTNIYLIWERHSYCDYGVVYTTLDKKIANKMLYKLNSNYEYERFYLEVMELDKYYKKEW